MDLVLDIVIMCVIGLIIVGLIITALIKCYKRVYSVDEILVIKKFKGDIKIAAQGGFVLPLFNSFTRLNLVPKKITVYSGDLSKLVSRSDQSNGIHNAFIHIGDGNYSSESIRVDLGVEFKLKVNMDNEQQVIDAVKMYGDLLSDAKELGQYLQGQLAEAVKTATRKLEFYELLNDRVGFREVVKQTLSKELDGLIVSDVSIIFVDHTPLDRLDPNNMLDNTGRKKIEEINAQKDIERATIAQDRNTQVTETEVKGEKERIQLTKSLEQEKAIANREIKNTQEEEETKIRRKAFEEELARKEIEIETQKKAEIATQEKERDVETVRINNEQIVGIKEQEARQEVETKRLDADMAADKRKVENETTIEKGRKDLIAQRAENAEMQDTLTKKEESIKDTVAFKAADRSKQVRLTEATAESEAQLISKTTEAKAEREAFAITAEKMKNEADAKFEVAKKGVEAGELEVELDIKRKSAPLKAEADARIVNAEAIRVEGEAKAEIISKTGSAEADVITSKGTATAEALRKQYEATNEAGEETRKHELAKIDLENGFKVKELEIKASENVGIEEAKARATALSKADLKIYGDQNMLGQVLGATTKAEVKNVALDNDKTKEWLKPYLSGEKSIPQELKEILSSIGGESGEGGELSKLVILSKLLKDGEMKDLFSTK